MRNSPPHVYLHLIGVDYDPVLNENLMKAHGLNPRIRKSPFFASTLKYGATEFHPYNSMWMPVGYDTPVNEYWNVVERAGLWDVGVQRCVEVSGPDAAEFVSQMTPRNIDKMKVGQCRYVFLTNQDGGILNDPVMLKIAEDRFWLSTADSDIYLWAKGLSVFSPLQVNIATPDVYPLQVQGPISAKIVSAVFGDAVLDLRYYHWMHGAVDGIEVVISRTGFSSEVGFEIYYLGRARGDELWELIMQAGRPYGLTPGSPNRIRRIEGGVLDYGSDVLVSNNPFEMGMDRLVDLNKPSFIGRSALRRIKEQGITRRMMGAFMSGPAFEKNNEHRWQCYADDRVVGEVTSAVHSPRLERNIGFALVDVALSKIGTQLRVDTPEGERDLEITSLPFIDPEKKIPRAPLR